jgi:hypothetical protein
VPPHLALDLRRFEIAGPFLQELARSLERTTYDFPWRWFDSRLSDNVRGRRGRRLVVGSAVLQATPARTATNMTVFLTVVDHSLAKYRRPIRPPQRLSSIS